MLSDTNCHGSYTVVARAATTAVVVVAAAVVVVVAVVVALALGLAATDHRMQCSCANQARGANSRGSQQAPFLKRKGCPTDSAILRAPQPRASVVGRVPIPGPRS